jgi:uridine kinase
MTNRPYVILLGGGTSSGKTSVAEAIKNELGESNITYINYDNYYFDLSHIPMEERNLINYDHPNSLDTKQLINDINLLINNKSSILPFYDFCTHTRIKSKELIIQPKKIILIEGILALYNEELRHLSNLNIFVDTPSDERLIRRIQRDTHSRNRTLNDIINQYKKTVKPMHEQFIEPTKIYADFIIPNGYNKVVVNLLVDSMICLINKT